MCYYYFFIFIHIFTIFPISKARKNQSSSKKKFTWVDAMKENKKEMKLLCSYFSLSLKLLGFLHVLPLNMAPNNHHVW